MSQYIECLPAFFFIRRLCGGLAGLTPFTISKVTDLQMDVPQIS